VVKPESDQTAVVEKEPWRRGLSIGDALAEGRRQAGLTVTQVSQRTCIRETIIRGIERGDFSGCGGDFYARGHIRSIASAVGVNPDPLIEEYDATMGAPQAISAADVFQPVTPVKLKERRRPNWTAAMVLALLVIVGVFAYQHFSSHSSTPARNDARVQGQGPSTAAKPKVKNSGAPAHHATAPRKLHISLTATQDCWVQLTSKSGATLFSGMVYAGNSMNWTQKHEVTLELGNPSGVKLRVNGKNPVPKGSVSMVTLTLRPGHVH
jgi:cytoskeletal protein RodZ